MGEFNQGQQKQSDMIANQLAKLSESNEKRIEKLRESVAQQLQQLQQGNEKKLSEMRALVDEKLQSTLEKRLGESLSLINI